MSWCSFDAAWKSHNNIIKNKEEKQKLDALLETPQSVFKEKLHLWNEAATPDSLWFIFGQKTIWCLTSDGKWVRGVVGGDTPAAEMGLDRRQRSRRERNRDRNRDQNKSGGFRSQLRDGRCPSGPRGALLTPYLGGLRETCSIQHV